MNKKPENEIFNDRLIFTLPASSFVVVLRVDWGYETGWPTVAARTYDWEWTVNNDSWKNRTNEMF
jgi:hypothetical protein